MAQQYAYPIGPRPEPVPTSLRASVVETVSDPEGWHALRVDGSGTSKSAFQRQRARLRRDPQLSQYFGDSVTGLDGKSYPATRDSRRVRAVAALLLLEDGYGVDEVAEYLRVSPRTVRRYRERYELVPEWRDVLEARNGQVSRAGHLTTEEDETLAA